MTVMNCRKSELHKLLEEHGFEVEVRAEAEEMPLEDGTTPEQAEQIEAMFESDKSTRPWPWCMVTVTVSYKSLKGQDHLGGCSYYSEPDFRSIEDGYYDDMVAIAYRRLKEKAERLVKEATEAVTEANRVDFIIDQMTQEETT